MRVPEDLTDASSFQGTNSGNANYGQRTDDAPSVRTTFGVTPASQLGRRPVSFQRLYFRNLAAGKGFQFAADQVWGEARAHEAAEHGSDLAVIDFAPY